MTSTAQHHATRHHATSYSDQMVAISDSDGNLVSIMSGPQAHGYASAFCDLPDLLADLRSALVMSCDDPAPDDRPLIAAAGRLILLAGAFLNGGLN